MPISPARDRHRAMPISSTPSDPSLVARLRATPLLGKLDPEVLDEVCAHLEPVSLESGEILFRRNDADHALYVVLEGRLEATLTAADGSREVLGTIGPGEAAGEIQLLTGGERTADVSAVEPSELVRLPGETAEWLTDSTPAVMRQLLEVIRRRLRHNQLAALAEELFGIDDAASLRTLEQEVEWVSLTSGEALFRQGDPGDCLWIVVSGLLVTVLESGPDGPRVVGEVGRGELLGEMALVADETRSASAYAVRDSELVRIDRPLFEKLVRESPEILLGLTRRVVRRLRRTLHAEPRKAALIIAVAPCGPDVPLDEFTRQLTAALAGHGPTLHLSAERVDGLLAMDGAARVPADDPRGLRLSCWLEEQEARHGFLVLETDREDSSWTRRCLQHAQRILLVATAGEVTVPGPVEAVLPAAPVPVAAARRILVLLHPDNGRPASGTDHWLAAREPAEHHHVRRGRDADYARLARFLSGRAVGLALGGGGARGFAHYGVYLALREAGVPVDMIGGTSMGAVIGAQCALGWDRQTMLDTNRAGLIRRRPFHEFTLPLFSLVRSRRLDQVLSEAHGETRIEDLWLPYFCVSSNLSRNAVMVHDRGSLWRSLRASSALPGIVLPVVSSEGLLVDGGLLNNLPGDVMREYCSTVIVVNVSAVRELQTRYGHFPSPWQVLMSRMLPGRESVEVPTILDVLMGSTMLSSVGRAQRVMAEADLCLEPPIERFGLLDFAALEELVDVGYRHARERIAGWLEQGAGRWRTSPAA